MALTKCNSNFLFNRNSYTIFVIIPVILQLSLHHHLLALNITSYRPETCLISNASDNNGSIIIHGSAHQTCKWNVSVPSGSSLSLSFEEWKDPESSLIYVEIINELQYCESMGLAIKARSYPCDISLPVNDVIIYLNSNTTFALHETVHETLTDSKSPACSNGLESRYQYDNSKDNCFNLKTYDYILEYSIDPYYMYYDNAIYRFQFKSNCQVVLGRQEAILQCESVATSSYQDTIPSQNDNVTAILIVPTSIAALDLTHNSISKIEVSAFLEFGFKLKLLNLGHNLLVHLDSHTFKGMTELAELSLGTNQLTSLEIRIFHDLRNLKQLDLSFNYLANLDSTLFHTLLNLELLNLFVNDLTYISHDLFENLQNLELLFLSGNSIGGLSGCPFKNLTNLRHIELSYNRIQNIAPCTFQNLRDLLILYLGHNQVQTLHKALFQGLSALKALFIQTNNLIKLDPNIFRGV